MSEILIAGSAGFVGSNIANYLVQHTNHMIASVDLLSDSRNFKNLQPAIQSKNRHTFYLARAEDTQITNKIFELEQPKVVVFNLLSYWLSTSNDSEKDIKTLVNWVDTAARFGCQKFIILADHRPIYDKLNHSQTRIMWEVERLCVENTRDMDMYAIVPAYVFGPRQSMNCTVPSIFKDRLTSNTQEELSAHKFEMIYVKDYFYNIMSFVENNYDSGVYFMRSGEAASPRDVSDYVQSIIDGEPLQFNWRSGAFNPTHDFIVEPRFFAWSPHYNLSSALEHTLCWYDANRWAWES